jgi:phosphate transport system permease protein
MGHERQQDHQSDHQLELDRGLLAAVTAGAAHRPVRARLGGATGADRRAERMLGALAAATLVLIAAMAVTVFIKAWPSFQANGLSWFAPGGNVDTQLRAMDEGMPLAGHSALYFRAWPLIWGTIITTIPAVLVALAISTLAAIFLTEFAPAAVRSVLEPVVRLLAGVPSVVYGLVAILALAPWIEDHLISEARKRSVYYVVQLSGANLMLAIIVLAIMITPIMIALIAGALASVPPSWKEGSAALGVNRWRTIVRVSLRTARPAIVAATVLATARALGEAIMLSMVSGSRGFAANPLDGLTFLFEPVRPLAATIVQESSGLTIGPMSHTLYAMAAVLLVSAALLSFAGWAAKQPLKRYGIRA